MLVQLLSPANEDNPTSPVTFSWEAISGAVEYQLQVASDFEFINIVYSVKLAGTSISLEFLDDSTYYWRVRYR